MERAQGEARRWGPQRAGRLAYGGVKEVEHQAPPTCHEPPALVLVQSVSILNVALAKVCAAAIANKDCDNEVSNISRYLLGAGVLLTAHLEKVDAIIIPGVRTVIKLRIREMKKQPSPPACQWWNWI